MREYRVDYVDAFTQRPFAGNPCAVVHDANGLRDEEMQAVAREVNLPETAFVFPSSKADIRVRYFTPRLELPFAGHPTVATVFALARRQAIPLKEPATIIDLECQVGVIPVEVRVADGRPTWVTITQPSPTFGRTFAAGQVAPCLGLDDSHLRSDCPSQVVGTGVPFLIVPVRRLEILRHVEMDRRALAGLCDEAEVSAAFAFSVGGLSPEADTHARLFDPRGTIEDPFTGSATGAMGAYVIHYDLKPGPTLVAEQGHLIGRPGRGILQIERDGGEIRSVKLSGAAVRVLTGMLFLPETDGGLEA